MQFALRRIKLRFHKSMRNETQEVTFKVALMGRCDLTYRSWNKFVANQRDTFLQETKQMTDPNGQTRRHVIFFYENISTIFCMDTTFWWELVFVIQLSSNAKISVRLTVWVTTNPCSISDMFKHGTMRAKKLQ